MARFGTGGDSACGFTWNYSTEKLESTPDTLATKHGT